MSIVVQDRPFIPFFTTLLSLDLYSSPETNSLNVPSGADCDDCCSSQSRDFGHPSMHKAAETGHVKWNE